MRCAEKPPGGNTFLTFFPQMLNSDRGVRIRIRIRIRCLMWREDIKYSNQVVAEVLAQVR